MNAWLEEHDIGKAAISYKLRDWLFSRQRYWGEPIPVIHCPACGTVAVPAEQLPVLLPEVERYEPTGTGESPLAAIEEWVRTPCPQCGADARRETNTMPQWAGSCWYYLRYIDPHNDTQFVAPEKERYWMPVDVYVGGAEHAVLHLLYARFWHKVLFDVGAVSTPEPFMRLVNQGMILGEDGEKMSKSRGNVINPDDVIREHGADALRLYEMFMGPLEQTKPWNTHGVEGVYRFLQKAWRLVQAGARDGQDENILRLRHKTIKKVTDDIRSFRFNTAISALMIFVNEATTRGASADDMETLAILLSPFAPHLAEELWHTLGHADLVSLAAWPHHDDALTIDDTIELVVQVNGKLRDRLSVAVDTPREEALALACGSANVAKWLAGKTVVKEIFVPNKLVNLVVK
jgi:leucyl-tRNA synthetase